MKVLGITPAICPVGRHRGSPMLNIRLSDKGEEMSMNDMVTRARDSKLKLVAIAGGVTANPECRPLVKAMRTLGKNVLVVCGADDSIEPLVRSGAMFILKTVAPTETQNTVNFKNFPFLGYDDEILFEVANQKDLDYAVQFVQGRLITKPEIIFDISKADASEKAGMIEIIQDLSGRLVCSVRVHE